MSVRVRYAPSPTGKQHIGSVRTAVFNYFFARANGGKFYLRIEDTDRERYDADSEQDLYNTLNWLGIQWDEGPDKGGDFGPYVQSERVELHRKYAGQLVEQGDAYYCFCTAERLEERREEQKAKKGDTGYDRFCRDLDPAEAQKRIEAGEPHVIRFKVPLEGKTEVEDVLLGTVKRKNKDINPDPVLLKTDGFPTYHMAHIVDDHYMETTHVLRAQEWLPSAPLHVLMSKALGWEPPLYVHLPTVMGKDGKKLSKRHGDTSIVDFIAKGYLPEALLNYVSLVGWSYDDKREFFTREELEELFTLDKLNKAPGVFDYKKLDWFNGQYLRQKSEEELKELTLPFLSQAGIVSDPVTAEERGIIDGMMPIMKDRLKLLADIVPLSRFLFQEIDGYSAEELIPKKMDAAGTAEILNAVKAEMPAFAGMSHEEQEQKFADLAEKLDTKLGNVMMPLRVAVTGSKMSPPLIQAIELLGLEHSIQRVENAISLLKREEE